MKLNTNNPLNTSALEFESDGTMNVVVLYEDFPAARSASQLLQRLSQKVEGNPKFRQSMWKFDHLILPQMEGLAAADTAAADLVILCSHESNPLPEAVKILLERWTSRESEEKRALVALLVHGPHEEPSLISVEGYLREISKQGDTAFFAQSIPSLATGDSSEANEEGPFPWRQADPGEVNVSRTQPFSRWGLNE